MKKGFTLVELLIVITVLGILAATILTVVNPQDKIAAANDAKIQQDTNQLINALQTYAAQDANGYYPTIAQGFTQLVTNGEINAVPVPPTGYGAAYMYYSDNTVVPPVAKVSGQVKSKKNRTIGGVVQATASWCWRSSTGTTTIVAGVPTAAATCP